MSRKNEGKGHDNPTVVIIDGDNIAYCLLGKGLGVWDLKAFVRNFLENGDKLVGIRNRSGDVYRPVMYVVSEKFGDDKQFQKQEFKWLDRKFGSFLEIFVVPPKTKNNEGLVSCTDAQVISLISIALFDSEIRKIIIVSGDGDFRIPLGTIGIEGKQIMVVGVEGTISGELTSFVKGHGGEVEVIEAGMPGLRKNKKNSLSHK